MSLADDVVVVNGLSPSTIGHTIGNGRVSTVDAWTCETSFPPTQKKTSVVFVHSRFVTWTMKLWTSTRNMILVLLVSTCVRQKGKYSRLPSSYEFKVERWTRAGHQRTHRTPYDGVILRARSPRTILPSPSPSPSPSPVKLGQRWII